MAREVYSVVLHDEQWKIAYDKNHYGPYESQREAINAAIDTAQKAAGRNPDGSQVRVQGEKQAFRTEWTYGKDPYPPKA